MEKTLKNFAARVISTIFIPPVFSIFCFIYLPIKFEKSEYNILTASLLGIIFSVILPICIFLYFRKKDKLTDIDALIKEERNIPYIFIIINYSLGLVFFYLLGVNHSIVIFMLANIIITLLIFIINYYWKISVHSSGAGAFSGFLFYFFGTTAGLISLLIVAIVCLSRIYLKCHTLMQTIAGAVLGFSIVYIFLKLFI